MTPTSLKYRPDIDGLRAIAVLLVVVFHFNLIPGGKSGFIGVDVFFVISGFLITAIITKQLDAGIFSFSSFYLHRIRRLAPALFAVLALVMLAGSLLLFPHELVELSKQVLASQLYVANIFYWKTINYFGLRADNVHLLHTWSLAVEEQFYLFYPLAIVLLHRFARRQFWTALALGFVASFALNLWMVAAKPEATFYLLPTRAWELLAGSLAFYASAHFARSRTADELLGIGGIGLITIGVVTFHEGVKFPGSFALLPVLGAAFLIVGGSRHPTTASRILSAPVAVYIGRISYTLYLVHWPVHVFAKQIFEDGYTTSMRAAMFALAIIISSAIFHLVESPIRGGRYLSSGAGIAKSYAVGLVLTLVLVSAAIFSHGLPQRFPEEAIRLASFAKDRNDDIPHCEFQGKPLINADHFCRIGVKGMEPDWLVIGDSHAWAAHAAFDKWLSGEGRAALFMFRNSCPPISGVHVFRDKGLCHAFNKAVTAFLDRHDSIRNVVWVSTWRQAVEGRLSTSQNLRLSRDDSVKLFEASFAASLEHLHRKGKRIYVWEPLPGARHDVPVALAKAARQGIPADVELGREEYFKEFDFFFRSLEANRGAVAQSFSPSAVLCGSGKCSVEANGNPLYFDNAHVTKSSADFWAAMLTDQYRRGSGESSKARF
jgi:peptidoglycan/LPS O-acetylase OafA/YrhL